jgi:hypothetical protein
VCVCVMAVVDQESVGRLPICKAETGGPVVKEVQTSSALYTIDNTI